MKADRVENLRATKVDTKVVLSGLWISMLFVFVYVDIFGFFELTSSTDHSLPRCPVPVSRSAGVSSP